MSRFGFGFIFAPGLAIQTPSQIFGADLAVWYMADTGITTVNGDVSQWNDQSSAGANLSQATANLRPTFSPTGVNGKQCVQFGLSANGATARATMLSTGTAAIALGAAGASFFLVGNVRAKAASSNSPRYLSFRSNGDANDFTSNNSGIPFLENSSDGNKLAWFRQSVSFQAAWAHSIGTPYRLGTVFDGSNGASYANNAQQAQAAMTSAFGATGQLNVGAHRAGDEAFTWCKIDVAEIVIVKRAATSQERSDLDSYFKDKWELS
jgi:hypothetical protein